MILSKEEVLAELEGNIKELKNLKAESNSHNNLQRYETLVNNQYYLILGSLVALEDVGIINLMDYNNYTNLIYDISNNKKWRWGENNVSI
jgi:hypothetical protein